MSDRVRFDTEGKTAQTRAARLEQRDFVRDERCGQTERRCCLTPPILWSRAEDQTVLAESEGAEDALLGSGAKRHIVAARREDVIVDELWMIFQ